MKEISGLVGGALIALISISLAVFVHIHRDLERIAVALEQKP